MSRLRDRTRDVLRRDRSDRGCRGGHGRSPRAWHAPDPVGAGPPAGRPARPCSRRSTRAAGRSRSRRATTASRRPGRSPRWGSPTASTPLVCADDGVPVKPAPDMVLRLCAAIGVPPARTAVVGDSAADLRMARAAGAGLAIGVLTGVGSASRPGAAGRPSCSTRSRGSWRRLTGGRLRESDGRLGRPRRTGTDGLSPRTLPAPYRGATSHHLTWADPYPVRGGVRRTDGRRPPATREGSGRDADRRPPDPDGRPAPDRGRGQRPPGPRRAVPRRHRRGVHAVRRRPGRPVDLRRRPDAAPPRRPARSVAARSSRSSPRCRATPGRPGWTPSASARSASSAASSRRPCRRSGPSIARPGSGRSASSRSCSATRRSACSSSTTGRDYDWTADETELARAFADHMATAIGNARLADSTRTMTGRLRAISELAGRLNRLQDVDGIAHAIVAEARTPASTTTRSASTASTTRPGCASRSPSRARSWTSQTRTRRSSGWRSGRG